MKSVGCVQFPPPPLRVCDLSQALFFVCLCCVLCAKACNDVVLRGCGLFTKGRVSGVEGL